MLLAIQVQGDAKAFLVGFLAPPQHRCIVTANLGAASAVGRRAVKLVQDQALDGMRAVVHAGRDDEHAEGVLFGWAETQLGR